MNEVLDEALDADWEPSEAEIDEYAIWLGMTLPADADLRWIAREGLKAPLPQPWKPCKTQDGEIFYFNFNTGDSTWDHPCDSYYRTQYEECKRRGRAARRRRVAPRLPSIGTVGEIILQNDLDAPPAAVQPTATAAAFAPAAVASMPAMLQRSISESVATQPREPREPGRVNGAASGHVAPSLHRAHSMSSSSQSAPGSAIGQGAAGIAARRLQRAGARFSRLQSPTVSSRTLEASPASGEGDGDDDDCSICMSCPRSVRFRPCGHASACARCTLRMLDAKARSLQCPICKRDVTTVEWATGSQATHRRDVARLPTELAASGPPQPSPVALARLVTFDEEVSSITSTEHRDQGLSLVQFVVAASDAPDALAAGLADEAMHADACAEAWLLRLLWLPSEETPRLWLRSMLHDLWVHLRKHGNNPSAPSTLVRKWFEARGVRTDEKQRTHARCELLLAQVAVAATPEAAGEPGESVDAALADTFDVNFEAIVRAALSPEQLRALCIGSEGDAMASGERLFDSFTPLMRAAATANLRALDAMLTAGSSQMNEDSFNAVDHLGYTALMHAVAGGSGAHPYAHAQAVSLAISRAMAAGIVVDASGTGPGGRSALHMAVLAGSHIGLQALLDLPSIDVNQFDDSEPPVTPLHLAARSGQMACLTALLADPRLNVNAAPASGGVSALTWAAGAGRAAAVLALVAVHGIDVNTTNPNGGGTALMYAVNGGHAEAVRALLTALPRGLDVSAQNAAGGTALYFAVSAARSATCVAALVEGVAGQALNVNAVVDDGDTALRVAMANGDSEIVRILMTVEGIDPSAGVSAAVRDCAANAIDAVLGAARARLLV